MRHLPRSTRLPVITLGSLLTLGASLGGAGSGGEPGDRPATISYDMAERTVDWLELVAAGASDDELRERFFDSIVPTEGCQVIIRHWSRFREWDAERFFEFVMVGLGRMPTDRPLEDETGAPTGTGTARRCWTAAMENPARLRLELAALREIGLEEKALSLARRALPSDADVTNRFHVVLFGGSTAFSVGDANGFDLLQMPRRSDGGLDIERVVSTFAHEMHHSGFSNASSVHMGDLPDLDRLRLVGMMAAEGMATWFTTPPFAHLDEWRRSDDPGDRALAADWDRHLAAMSELYERAEVDIRRGLAGELTMAEIMESWLSGMQGAAYAVGTDMIRTIEKELGSEAAVSVSRDYRALLTLYNQAASRANAHGEDRFVFETSLASAVSSFGADQNASPPPR